MVQRCPALLGRLDENFKVGARCGLADKFGKAGGA
jgi:hypothetical protein